jgi:predicted XRE-type DNA-binding protein
MKTQIFDDVEIHTSSSNVFADLGLADAKNLKIKTGLIIQIRKTLQELGLTQQEAAKRMGISQPKVSDMMRGEVSRLSEHKLMDCLTRLGYNIEIKIQPTKALVGQLKLSVVEVSAANSFVVLAK